MVLASGSSQHRVVHIARSFMGVERLRIRLVQKRIFTEALNQVRIRDEQLAESHRVAVPTSDRRIGTLPGELFVRNVHTAKLFLQLGSKPPRSLILTRQ